MLRVDRMPYECYSNCVILNANKQIIDAAIAKWVGKKSQNCNKFDESYASIFFPLIWFLIAKKNAFCVTESTQVSCLTKTATSELA